MLFTPKWIVRHIVVLVVLSLFFLAAFWQIHRLHERQAHNREVRTQTAKPPVDLTATPQADPYRRVVATGHYDAKNQVLLRAQVLNDNAGDDVLTPLVLSNGHAVLVDRGWIPISASRAPAPREGLVRIEGLALPPEHKRPFSPDIPPTGHVTSINYVNVKRLAKQMPYPLVQNYVLLSKQRPASKLPLYEARPELTDGPHRGYAVQWVLFFLVGLIGYIAFMRRETKKGPPDIPRGLPRRS